MPIRDMDMYASSRRDPAEVTAPAGMGNVPAGANCSARNQLCQAVRRRRPPPCDVVSMMQDWLSSQKLLCTQCFVFQPNVDCRPWSSGGCKPGCQRH